MKCVEARWILFEGKESPKTCEKAREHASLCQECRQYLTNDQAFGNFLKKNLSPVAILPHLKEHVMEALAAEKNGTVNFKEKRLPLFYKKALVAALILSTMGIGVIFFRSMNHPAFSPFVESLIADHIEYLPNAHPEQIFSSSPQEIEKWFKGKLPFLFTVPNVEKANLLGGRLCILRGEKAALLFYEITGQSLSLFIMSNEKKPLNDLKTLLFKDQALRWTASKGVNVVSWEKDGVVYAMVSKMDKSTLINTIHSF